MTCRDMNTYLDRVGDAPLPAEAAEHLTQCSRCRNLYLRMRPAPPATKRGQLAPLGIPLGILDNADLRAWTISSRFGLPRQARYWCCSA